MSALDDLKVGDIFTVSHAIEVDILLNMTIQQRTRIAELEAETLSLHHVISECEDNLKSMVEQYCRGHNFNQNDPSKYEYAHEFMSAGECTFEYLVARGLAEYTENGVDIRLVKK